MVRRLLRVRVGWYRVPGRGGRWLLAGMARWGRSVPGGAVWRWPVAGLLVAGLLVVGLSGRVRLSALRIRALAGLACRRRRWIRGRWLAVR